MDRRTFLTGLGALAAAPALPALSHGEYAGEGLIGVRLEWVEVGHPNCRCSLLPYQQVIFDWLQREPYVRAWHETMMGKT